MEETQNETIQLNEEEVRLDKLKTLQKSGENPFKYTFNKTHSTDWVIKNFNHLENGESIKDTN